MTKTADDPTEVVICPRCNATYSEGEAHECVPQPAGSGPNAVGWSFQLVTGVVIGLVGGLGARFWYTLVRDGVGGSIVTGAAAVFTIVCFGSCLWIVIGCLARPPE